MADTGAPYFIPYVEPTDLVRDYPAADEASADAIAAALDAIPVLAGIGSNVVQAVKTNTAALQTSSAFLAIPGLEATITLTSADSKVLLIGNVSAENDGTTVTGQFRFLRGSTAVGVGDADGVRTRATNGASASMDAPAQDSRAMFFVDTPGSAGPHTYKIEVRNEGGRSTFINRSAVNANVSGESRPISSLIAIEVAA